MTMFSKYLEDDNFIGWVVNPNDKSNAYWEAYLKNNPFERENVQDVKEMILAMEPEDVVLTVFRKKRILDKLIARKKEIDRREGIFRFIRKTMRYGAALVLMVGLAAIYIYMDVGGTHNKLVIDEEIITLTLDDGTVKIIDEDQVQHIVDKAGTIVASQNGEELDYKIDAESEKLAYNSLFVPYGKTFKLVLSDGSHVFLNSGSKLRYPVTFLKGVQRDVFLDGEAYFSVENDETRPFTVITDGMNTQVYGTEFNVSNYKDENNTSVVLVEGSVGVYKSNNSEGQKPVTIIPGQRAVFEDGDIAIDWVNVNKYTAWTEGKLFFVDDGFDLILKELERHFNVIIDNQFFLLNKKRFTGTFTNESLIQILKTCQEHTPFEYNVDGDTITITKKE